MRADEDELVAVLRAQAMAAVVAGGAFAGERRGRSWRCSPKPATGCSPPRRASSTCARTSAACRRRSSAPRPSGSPSATRSSSPATKIVATDPLEAASAYQTLQVQLESIYTVTARLANLRFTNFLR